MLLPIRDVPLGQSLRSDHKQVLGVVLFRRFREVEAAGDDRRLVDDHELVVSDGMSRVDVRGDGRMGGEVCGAILFLPLRPVKDDLNMHASLMRINKGRGDRRGSERISLDEDLGRPNESSFILFYIIFFCCSLFWTLS